ncbi:MULTISPECIES: metallophosphoesterase family protein [unclassified Leptolyngbya]|uniref:metallophosphoesterase family protein n=1 Tax=unclassified Leptolyngbya TaxID=2650499 RepID=UPI001682AA2F|nr:MULTISPECIES: metallophosphoesterase family protein [unclassified Leptolyngbya]MBD1912401.1 metallophosphoesterase family protein [Leptolyngbya sp. FACHB-8]MBD2154805.1 metallophosphoesterase family protein [Leptolyngbya sp. FACHB-16]
MASSKQPKETDTLIGVISDTHGLLRPEAIDALAGSSLILHAGDIGKPEILEGLQAIAPTIAVRGNNDKGAWAEHIPEHETIEVGRVLIHVLHILKELTFDPKEKGIGVVITGHSHKPLIEEREGVLFLNPGSAGPRRFKLPISVAQLHLNDSAVHAEIVELEI